MRVLGLETSGNAVSAALATEEVVAEAWVAAPQQHCRELVPLVDWCLSRAGLTLADVEGVAVALGPGSFTGLRIGLATAKALALAAGVPLAGVPSLEVAAAAAEVHGGLVCPTLWSRPGEVYWALLRKKSEEWDYLTPPGALAVAALASELARREEEVWLCGEAAKAVAEAAASGRRLRLAPATGRRLLAAEVARLGRARLVAGQRDDPMGLEPLYLRPPGITRPRR
ncbi:MAG: tRNA (adenosine(37)-N6)-threonylcarbamoyltransferase complex dimerization subunit type 1 TsaB [Moorellales bacterium]